jgi:hypothetical protein
MARVEIRVPDWLDRIFAWPVMWYRKRRYGEAYRKIYLGEGKFTTVSPIDYYQFNVFHWYAEVKGYNTYAVRAVSVPEKRRTRIVSMHREIMNHPEGHVVDHKNGDGLDNRRSNLRKATKAQNMHNRRKRKNTSSKYIGVSFHKTYKAWVSQIVHEGKRRWIGKFESEIEAARAFDEAAEKYHGEFARLNFPEGK